MALPVECRAAAKTELHQRLHGYSITPPPGMSKVRGASSPEENGSRPMEEIYGRLSESVRHVKCKFYVRRYRAICCPNGFFLRMTLRKLETVRCTGRPNLVEEVLVSVTVKY